MSTEEDLQYTTEVENVDAWFEAGLHTVTCPSGSRVKIRIPDLSDIIEGGDLPQHLLDAALAFATGQRSQKKLTKEDLMREREFSDFLVTRTVVQPKVDMSMARRVPAEDKEMLVMIATRQRDIDAMGDHIAGLHKSEHWRKFRRVGEFHPSVEGMSFGE